MKKNKVYRFEITSSITVMEEGETAEEARTKVVDCLADGEFNGEFGNASDYVSDGELDHYVEVRGK